MGIAILDATGLIRGRLLSISFYNKGGKMVSDFLSYALLAGVFLASKFRMLWQKPVHVGLIRRPARRSKEAWARSS